MRKSRFLMVFACAGFGIACGNNNPTTAANTPVITSGPGADTTTGVGTGSEVATSAVSGALNQGAGSAVAINTPTFKAKPSLYKQILDSLAPVSTAWALPTASCTGGSLAGTNTTKYDGSAGDPYTFTPESCTVVFPKLNKEVSSIWSSSFTLNYNSSCDDTHPLLEHQTGASCELTRTTGADGNTRTITGPDGNEYKVTHNTNGQGTEWEVQSGAPTGPSNFDASDITNNGLIRTCASTSGACADGQTLQLSGSHLTATMNDHAIWDHTVYTTGNGLAVTWVNGDRTVNGTVTVQHNLAKFQSTSTFENVTYGDANCCFPTLGTVTTTFANGDAQGKTETLVFDSSECGSATLTKTNGASEAFTLLHCL